MGPLARIGGVTDSRGERGWCAQGQDSPHVGPEGTSSYKILFYIWHTTYEKGALGTTRQVEETTVIRPEFCFGGEDGQETDRDWWVTHLCSIVTMNSRWGGKGLGAAALRA